MPELDAVTDKEDVHPTGENLKEGRRNDPEADVTVSVKLEDLMDNTGETLSRLPVCLPLRGAFLSIIRSTLGKVLHETKPWNCPLLMAVRVGLSPQLYHTYMLDSIVSIGNDLNSISPPPQAVSIRTRARSPPLPATLWCHG